MRVLLMSLMLVQVAAAQDSLFLSTDKPGTLWEDNPGTLGTKIHINSTGVVSALKFYKTDSWAGNYILTLWSNSQIMTTVTVNTTATGWVRAIVNAPVIAGDYVVSVYNPYGRYGFRNSVFPRVRGQLSGDSGRFEYGNLYPGKRTTTCYYADIVFSPIVEPTVKISPDSIVIPYPWKTSTAKVRVENYSSYWWEIVDQIGDFKIDTTARLSPLITPLTEGSLFMVLNVISPTGEARAYPLQIVAEPDSNNVMGYIMKDGKVIWRRRVLSL